MKEKFQFKLQGLLKLREFSEEKIKMQMGEILKEIKNAQNKILELKEGVEGFYSQQEVLVKESDSANNIKIFPLQIEASRLRIERQENLIYSLQKKYEEKQAELRKARAESKVISNLKEKAFQEYRKEINKKEQEDIEELFTMMKSKERSL